MTGMPYDPRGFHRVAHEIVAAHDADESYLRTAIGRAYYACFHLAKAGLERDGRWHAGTVNAHERVIQELYSRRRAHLANGLRTLRRLRERADYDLSQAVDAPHAKDVLEKADVLFRLLTSY